MPKRTPYENLSLVPIIVAETVCSHPYTEQEMSWQARSAERAEKVEAKRKDLTIKQRQEFVDVCDARCRAAYNARADWFMKCVRSKSRMGYDQLYIWMSHWMASYLNDPETFLKRHQQLQDMEKIVSNPGVT
jgi:hypothetical protein